MTPEVVSIPVEVNIAADTEEEREVVVGRVGTWRLDGAIFVPSTTTAANASNYFSVDLLNGTGGTSCATALTTATVAATKGTPREFTLTENASREVNGLTGCIEVDINMPGTGGAIDGMFVFTFRKVR